MEWKKIKYMFFVCVIAFAVWIAGELLLMFVFPNSSLTAARVWVILVFSSACAWCIRHFYVEDKRKKEDEENDNYKGVY